MDAELALLERWRAGDRAAGEALFARHFDDVYRFLEYKVGVEADDLTQRTFLACVAAKEQFRMASSFRTYLFAIARNELYRWLRDRGRRPVIDFDATSIAEIVTPLSERLGRQQQIELMRACLRELPAEQQLLLELHYWYELDAQALAEVFDAPSGTIRVRLVRARRALRERLGPAAEIPASDRLGAALRDEDT